MRFVARSMILWMKALWWDATRNWTTGAAWRRESCTPRPDDLVAQAWADTRSRYHIPARYALQLIDGVARDMTQTRYKNFDDLATYCYGVASTVGLMSMYIVGFNSNEALPYAIKLGVALQLTNILRDVGEDYRNGRIYLPKDELKMFGISETDLARGVVGDKWRAFMKFQIQRTRKLYAESEKGIQFLERDGQLAIAAASTFYQAFSTPSKPTTTMFFPNEPISLPGASSAAFRACG